MSDARQPLQSLWSMPLASFREAVVRRSSPGCGAAAAASADFGLALVMKGLKISNAKHHDARRTRLLEDAEELLEQLADYADQDVQAFEEYLEAMKMSKNSESERVRRQQALDEAALRVNRIPLITAEACLDGLGLAEAAFPLTDTFLQSDTVAGALLLHSGLSSVLLNVDTNLSSLDDAEARQQAADERHAMQEDADRRIAWLRARAGVP